MYKLLIGWSFCYSKTTLNKNLAETYWNEPKFGNTPIVST